MSNPMLTQEPRRNFVGYIEGYGSIAINILLFGLKIWVGMVTRSVAIIADAWHTLSDSFTSIVVVLGIKISSFPADKKHPFGHGRAEIIGSLIIGTLLAIVGFNFLVESVHRFIDRQSADYSGLAAMVFLVSVLLKEGLAQFATRAGRKFESYSLVADGWHHRSDAIASLLILAGMYLGRFWWWIDSVMGVGVAGLIFYATFDIMKESVSRLIGEEPDAGLVRRIGEIVDRTVNQHVNMHHLHLHRYGNHRELTFHVNLPGERTLQEAHDTCEQLEQRIREETKIEATIHCEPTGVRKD